MDVDAEPIIDGELIQNTTAKSPAQAASANQSPSLSLTPRASLGTRLAPSRPFTEDVESDVSDDSDDDDEVSTSAPQCCAWSCVIILC